MINKLMNMAEELIKFSWPMIFISIIIVSSIRITYLIKNKKKFVLYKELLMLLFIIYILSLFQIVTFQDVSWSGNNFIPFKEITRYKIGSGLFYRNVFGNMLLFVPFGLFVSHLLKLKKPLLAFVLTLIASLSIEFMQLIIGRVFDVDDILLNVIGGLVGYYIYYFVYKISVRLPSLFKSETFLNILTILLILLVGGFYLYGKI